ncbi:type VI secretion system baseplate subunit TssK [Halopseudomonas salegens]|uniref:Type VI secretion system protein ImpJ n=1 Tax=Halopseudomonas salegens TaxID=1434072 RepID=A0A1H2E024_9GAMM|nr:type VI secretion system baseplate subunit TssK [Halopseudomonas salegens]SDT88492.1 type VI secretion system protein ImpJ [Halopseudomonas salegens]
MGFNNKVVWSEGMFLRPQHFQQQERYIEYCLHERNLASEPYYWGFKNLELDTAALAIGKIRLLQAEGILPDGTPFSFPDMCDGPEPKGFVEGAVGEIIYLALPLKRPGVEETIFEEKSGSLARYIVSDDDVNDCNSIGGDPAELQTGIPRFRLLMGKELTDAWTALAVAKVIECKNNRQLVLEKDFVPPLLRSGCNHVFHAWIVESLGLVYQRADVLAERLNQPGRGGVSQVSEFLMLQMLNRYQPVLWHAAECSKQHPESLYKLMIQIVGELAAFSKSPRRPAEMPKYNHDNLRDCFEPLMLVMRESLSQVLEQTAIQIDLQEKNYGIYVGHVGDKTLLKSANFIIAAHASITGEMLRTQFLSQVKIGPTSKIRDLVNLHLPGVKIKPLPIAPREIPYHSGYNYFEMECNGELWGDIQNSGAFALHVAGEFPNLELECWAIRK